MVCRGLTFRTGITFALFQHYLIKLASILKKVCRDASLLAVNRTGRISAFKSGNKLQLSVDYLSVYPLLPLHYLCSLLFYYKGICTRCVEVCDTYLIVLMVCPDYFFAEVGDVETYFTHTIHVRESVPPIVILLYRLIPVIIEVGLIVWAIFVRFLFNATF